MVFRESGGDYTVVDRSELEVLAPNALNEFTTRLSVQAGDLLGLTTTANAWCFFTGVEGDHRFFDSDQTDPAPGATLDPDNESANTRWNIEATLEQDADRDGFGDETQDACPTNAATQATCPTPPVIDPPDTDLPDTDPPETTITRGPKNKSGKNKAKFKFVSDEPGSTFECKIDKKPFKPCISPKRFKVKDGKHKFLVRAIDQAGNVDPTPDKDKFKVVG